MSVESIDYLTGEVITSAELVPMDNMAAVEALDPQAREMAVTHMLSEARAWLAHAVESTSPQSIANFKAQMATIAEATKQLNLSKEIQSDALAMVRRSEGALATGIRRGQSDGTVARPGQRRNSANGVDNTISFPSDFVSQVELHGNGYGIMSLADVTSEELDAAIDVATEEGNLSRANVVRKVRDIAEGGPETRKMRAEKITDLAAQGYSTRQIAPLVGIGEEAVANIIRDYAIIVPADATTKGTRRIKSADVINNVIGTIDAATYSLALINPNEIQGDEINSLIQSINALRKAANKIKESIS